MKRLIVIFLLIALSFSLNVSYVSASLTEYKLTPDDGADNDNFGMSVAVSGNTVIIGAPDDDDNGDNSGSAYVFVRSGESWSQQAKLTADDGTEDAGFGCSVAIDGDTAVIGAAKDLENNNTSGSTYVFIRSGESWSQQAKLIPDDSMPGDMFGWSVDVDDSTVVVGAYGNTDSKGSVYVFLRDGSSWTQQARIDAGDDAMPGDSFGYSASLSGNSIIIGVPYDDDYGSNSGSAYIFLSEGSSWTEQAKLTPSDPIVEDKFGYSVSIGGDISAIGAYGDDGYEGSAYVFIRDSGVWTQQEKLEPADNTSENYVGWSVAVSEDSTLVAAPFSNDLTGLAYLFLREEGIWTQQTSISPSDSEPYILFGLSVAISNDIAVIGAPYGSDEEGNLSGSAYIFELAVNVPPVADAGGPYTVDEGNEITLDASTSYDLDDGISLYEWDLDYDGEYDDATGETKIVVYSDNDIYTVGLKVTDSKGAFSTNSTTVTVVNVPPTVNAGPDITINFGEEVFIDASFTDPGTADTHIATVYWGDSTSEPGAITEPGIDPGTVTGNHIYAWPGIYEVTIEVIDDDAGMGLSNLIVDVLPVAAEMVETLNDEIKALQLPDGKEKSKEVSLDTAIKILNDSNPENDKAAINTLESLINKLESQRGKQITVDIADKLIGMAREIIAILSIDA
jgi:hypothetical protein